MMFFIWAFLLTIGYWARGRGGVLMSIGGITGIAWGILLLKEAVILSIMVIPLNFYILYYSLFEGKRP